MNDIDHKHAFDGKQDRNFHQKPFDDVTDPLPQIDEKSASLSENPAKKETGSEQEDAENGKETDAAGYNGDINEDDVRDQGDSTKDWDAEHSRTGRHK
jgi:hypothetical protein